MIAIPTPEQVQTMLASPACSSWLRGSIRKAWNRDPVDAMQDAESLVLVLRSWIGTVPIPCPECRQPWTTDAGRGPGGLDPRVYCPTCRRPTP